MKLAGLMPSLPPEIELLPAPTTIDLNFNDIQVQIQDFIVPPKHMPNLQQLGLTRNPLTGWIPTDFGGSHGSFSGSEPSHWRDPVPVEAVGTASQ